MFVSIVPDKDNRFNPCTSSEAQKKEIKTEKSPHESALIRIHGPSIRLSDAVCTELSTIVDNSERSEPFNGSSE
jgi:hypothetical protein